MRTREQSEMVIDYVPMTSLCALWINLSLLFVCVAVYPCVILQDKRRDVDLLRFDAGEELLQVVQVADFVLHPWHTEGGEEPRWDLEWANEKWRKREEIRKEHFISYRWHLILIFCGQDINLALTNNDKTEHNFLKQIKCN